MTRDPQLLPVRAVPPGESGLRDDKALTGSPAAASSVDQGRTAGRGGETSSPR